jgi:hypothetical protein
MQFNLILTVNIIKHGTIGTTKFKVTSTTKMVLFAITFYKLAEFHFD